MIKKIATVGVYVTDQARAREFWTKKVGFELRRETPMGPAGSWLEVAPPGAESCLVIYPWAMADNAAELKPSIVFDCDDCAAAYEQMKARGVKFLDAPQSMPWGTFVKFVDEDSNEFLLKGPPR
jgi:lactoylglutathione lyase